MREMGNYIDYLRKSLKDQEEAQCFLEVTLESYAEHNNTEAFLTALRITAEAQEGLAPLAKRLHLGRGDFYRALSDRGHLKPEAINCILLELGFKDSGKSLTKQEDRITH